MLLHKSDDADIIGPGADFIWDSPASAKLLAVAFGVAPINHHPEEMNRNPSMDVGKTRRAQPITHVLRLSNVNPKLQ